MKRWRLLVAAAAVAACLGNPNVARASEDYPENAGWGVLAVFANLGYMPVKTVYAVLGGLTGGFAYVFTAGSYETASNIWSMSMGGTYVLTPSMIRGEDPILFAGSSTRDSGAVTEAPPVDETQSNRSRHEESLPAS